MPTDTKTTAEPTAPTPDPRDALIAQLQQQVADALADVENADATIEELEAQLKEAKMTKAVALPATDYAVIGGKTYHVERTVEAKFATDEARKGYIEMGATLAVLKD